MFNKTYYDKTLYDRLLSVAINTTVTDRIWVEFYNTRIMMKQMLSAEPAISMDMAGTIVHARVPAAPEPIELGADIQQDGIQCRAHVINSGVDMSMDMYGDTTASIFISCIVELAGPDIIGADMSSRIPIQSGAIDISIGEESSLAIAQPIGSVLLDILTEMESEYHATVMIPPVTVNTSIEMSVAPIRQMDSESLTLQQVNLRPGGTIEIDTGTLDVLRNGAPDVTSVTTQSTFFKLIPGTENLIYFRDNASARNLTINFVYENWWL